jgi:cytochrome c-type biogenesis protein CcmE
MAKKRNLKFVVGGAILISAISYLIFSGIQKTALYYLTVSEFEDKGASAYGELVKVNGRVVEGSIQWNSEDHTLHFIITDGEKNLQVRYRGVAPDTFKNGTEVVVRGVWEPGNVFKADKIMAKCPSRYEAE